MNSTQRYFHMTDRSVTTAIQLHWGNGSAVYVVHDPMPLSAGEFCKTWRKIVRSTHLIKRKRQSLLRWYHRFSGTLITSRHRRSELRIRACCEIPGDIAFSIRNEVGETRVLVLICWPSSRFQRGDSGLGWTQTPAVFSPQNIMDTKSAFA